MCSSSSLSTRRSTSRRSVRHPLRREPPSWRRWPDTSAAKGPSSGCSSDHHECLECGRMSFDSLERLSTVLAGRYAIERELARGGMATVYLADDLRHQRKVAVKVLRPELASALGPDRFAREIAIAARLNH